MKTINMVLIVIGIIVAVLLLIGAACIGVSHWGSDNSETAALRKQVAELQKQVVAVAKKRAKPADKPLPPVPTAPVKPVAPAVLSPTAKKNSVNVWDNLAMLADKIIKTADRAIGAEPTTPATKPVASQEDTKEQEQRIRDRIEDAEQAVRTADWELAVWTKIAGESWQDATTKMWRRNKVRGCERDLAEAKRKLAKLKE